MKTIRHFNILYKLFVTDGKPNKNWQRITLGTKAKTKYTAIKHFIYNTTTSHSYGEFIYLLTHNWEYPTCPVCGNTLTYKGGFKTYCSRRCARSVQDVSNIANIRHEHYIKSKEHDITIDTEHLSQYDKNYINELVNNGALSKKYYSLRTSLNKEDTDIKYWLNNRINWSKGWAETIYCITHNIIKQPRCKICENPVKFISFNKGYRIYCSPKCVTSDTDIKNIISKKNTINGKTRGKKASIAKKARTKEQIQQEICKAKQTKLNKYGDKNYSNHEQAKQTNIKKYGCTCPLHSDLLKYTYSTKLSDERRKLLSDKLKLLWSTPEYRNNILNKIRYAQQNLSEESKQSKLTGYYNWWNNLSDHERDIHNKNISTGVVNWSKTLTDDQKQQKLQKEYITKKKNNTFNVSTPEDELAEYIKQLFPDMIRQYKSVKYPYNCDYYIPCIDMYIEYQGSWTHGQHPFGTDKSDNDVLNMWKEKNTNYYNNAIKTWTVRDVEKRTTAKENNLNYLELFENVNESKKIIYELYKSLQEYEKSTNNSR